MPFNISTFQSVISTVGYLTTNKFEVLMNAPPVLLNTNVFNSINSSSVQNIANGLRFRIESIRTPGVAILTSDINHYGIGPTQKQPHNAQFSENSLSILCDKYGLIWQFWHDWARNVFEFTGTTNSINSSRAANRIPSYTSNFKNEYSTTMQVVIYDSSGNVIQKMNMFEAFPISVREVALNWADSGNLIRLNIGVAYTDYTIENSGIGLRGNIAAFNNVAI